MIDAPHPAPWRLRYRPDLPTRLLPAAVVATALVIAFLAVREPVLAVAAAIALAFVPITVTRPIAGLAVVLLLSFLETYSAVTGALSLTKILGGVLVLAWLAFVATSSHTEREAKGLIGREPVLAAALVLLVAWAAMSLVWAEDPATAQDVVLRFALNFVLFPVALVAVRTPRHVAVLVVVFVVGALTAVVFGLATGTVDNPADEGRLKGAGLNPNQLGSYLVAAAVMCAVLAANRRWSPAFRLGPLMIAALALIAVFMTLSRGALVGLAAALLVAPVIAGRGRRLGALIVIAAALIGTVGWYATIAPASAVERITHPERGGGSGREDLWRVGWRMVEDNAVVGVGAGNFPVSSIHYLLEPGATQRDAYIVSGKVAHNIYLTVLSELGIIGLTLFLIIVAACLRSALRAARAFARRGEIAMELIARGVFIALFSMLVTGFFSSALYSKQMWLLLALAPALRAIADPPRIAAGLPRHLGRPQLVRPRAES